MKSIRKLLLSVLFLATGLSVSAYDFASEGIYYDVTSTTDLTVAVTFATRDYNSYTGAVVVPENVTNDNVTYTVTSIGNYAFYNSATMTSVTLPTTVTSLGLYAFAGCSALEAVAVPDAVTAIPNYAFYQCAALKSFTVSDKITSIGTYAFRECVALETIDMGVRVQSIGSNAFFGCSNLTSVEIPSMVTYIGTNAFGMNPKLTAINVAALNLTYSSVDGVLYDRSKKQVLACPGGKTSVTLPETLTTIANYAFRECGELTEIVIPNSVTSVGSYAFRACTKLAKATIGSGVTTIGNSAFYGCTALTDLQMGSAVETISQNAFIGCSNLTAVSIPASAKTIGTNAFGMCTKLAAITVDDSNTAYASVDGVLYNKALTQLVACPGAKGSIAMPETLTSIADYAFSGCISLTEIIVPSKVTTIGADAFYYCENLTSVTIGSGVTTIGEYAFNGCSALNSVVCYATVPATGNDNCFLEAVYTNATLYVPAGTSGAYAAASPWKNFTNVEELPATTGTVIADEVKVAVDGGNIVVTGAAAGTTIQLFDLNGKQLYSGEDTTIDASMGGLFIVRVAGESFKVAVE